MLPPPIDIITQTKSYWYRIPQTNMIGAFADYSDWTKRYNITDEYLTNIHPDLPFAVDALITHNGRTRGPEVDAMVKLVTGNVVHLPLVDGTTVPCANVLKLNVNTQDVLWVTADVIDTVPVQHENKTLHVVHDVNTRNLHIDRSKLDAVYPGWAERLKIGKELAVSTPQLLGFVFDSTKKSNIAIPSELSFD